MGIFQYDDYQKRIYSLTTDILTNCQLDPFIFALKSRNDHYRVWLLQKGYDAKRAYLHCLATNDGDGLRILQQYGYGR